MHAGQTIKLVTKSMHPNFKITTVYPRRGSRYPYQLFILYFDHLLYISVVWNGLFAQEAVLTAALVLMQYIVLILLGTAEFLQLIQSLLRISHRLKKLLAIKILVV